MWGRGQCGSWVVEHTSSNLHALMSVLTADLRLVYHQSRSLASETMRRVSRLGLRAVDPVWLDWYLLDLEGELSAFDGTILVRCLP